MGSKYRELADYDHALRLIVVGDYNTGKTTFINTYIRQDSTNTVYDPTIGIDFASRNIELGGGEIVKLACWDTSGQENFRSIVRSYYKDICGAFLVYDVTSRRSFANLLTWMNDIRRNASCKGHEHPILLLGTKIDVGRRQVPKEDALRFADDNNLLYAETNALTGENLDLVVPQFAARILRGPGVERCKGIKHRMRAMEVEKDGISLQERSPPGEKTCCVVS